MPKNTKQTSPKAASAASKVLRDGRTGKASKTAAGSALSVIPSASAYSFSEMPIFFSSVLRFSNKLRFLLLLFSCHRTIPLYIRS